MKEGKKSFSYLAGRVTWQKVKTFIIIEDKQMFLLRDFVADLSYSRVPESEVLKRKLIKNTLVKIEWFICTGPWSL